MQKIYKHVHFRRLKEIIKAIDKKYGIDLQMFDLDNIVCYKTTGDSFPGPVSNVQEGFTIFDPKELYTCFELSDKTNNKKRRLFGNFLLVRIDSSGSYTICKMQVNLINKKVCSYYYFLGTYIVHNRFGKNISILSIGTNGAYAYKFNGNFDTHNNRATNYARRFGTNTTIKTYLSTKPSASIVSKKNVKIYR